MPLDLSNLPLAELKAAEAREKWLRQARHPTRGGKQLPPLDLDWEILLFLCGRGFGKTAAQVQWAWWEAWRVPNLIVHAIAPTLSDVRGTTFEGPAGFLAAIPNECLLEGTREKAYNKSTHELRLSNGSLIRGFGAVEEGGRLRGVQCGAMVCDELREWDKPSGNLEISLNNALFGLRLPYPDGTPSRAVMGTTRKAIAFLKRFEKRPGVRVVHGTSYENLPNLATSFRSQILSLVGTKLGRQEVDSLDIEDDSDPTVIKKGWVRLWPFDRTTGRHRPLPDFSYIVESYDTAASEENFDKKNFENDPTASIVLGVFNVNQVFNEVERKRLRIRAKYACLLLDCWSERLGLPDLLDKARLQHRKKWGPADQARRADIVLIENKSSGPGVRQMLSKWGVSAWPMEPRGSKLMRLHAASPLVFQGMLFVPESVRPDRMGLPISWADRFIGQLCAFPGKAEFNGETDNHDDYVDAISQALTYLRDNGMLEATPEEEFLDLEEKIDHDRAEAVKAYAASKQQEKGNPYG